MLSKILEQLNLNWVFWKLNFWVKSVIFEILTKVEIQQFRLKSIFRRFRLKSWFLEKFD